MSCHPYFATNAASGNTLSLNMIPHHVILTEIFLLVKKSYILCQSEGTS